MKLFAHDLALARMVYDEGKEPEMTVRVPKGDPVPAVGETVELSNFAGKEWIADRPKTTALCEAQVLAVAVVVRPDWSTFRNPRAEREQGSLL